MFVVLTIGVVDVQRQTGGFRIRCEITGYLSTPIQSISVKPVKLALLKP